MKRILLLASVLFLMNSMGLAQKRQTVQNLPKYDKQKIHFGFALGINSCNFKIDKNVSLYSSDTLFNVDNVKKSGFNLGIVTNLHMGQHFDLRFIPDLCFAQRDLVFTFYENGKPTRTPTTKKIESTFIEFPLLLKFKSDRVGNFRAYAIAGVQYNIDMVSQAKVENKDREYVKLKKKDYGYTIGAGTDFYLEMFKLSLEVRMFNGIPNLLVTDNTVFSNSMNSLKTKMFQFSIFFE
jgi:opacity protein-like surface antigen